MSRAQFPPSERATRSKLAKLIHEEPLMRGTLSVRELTCGKPSCRCHRGEKHTALYLSYGEHGRVHQVFIPRDAEEQVRQWVRTYSSARELLEQVSALYRQRLQSLKARGG